MILYLFGGTQKEKHSFVNLLGKTTKNVVVKRSYLQPLKEIAAKAFDYKLSLLSLDKIDYVGDITEFIPRKENKENYINDLKSLYDLINLKKSNCLIDSLMTSSIVDLDNLNDLLYCFVFTDISSKEDLIKIHKHLRKFKITSDKIVKNLFPAIDKYYSTLTMHEKSSEIDSANKIVSSIMDEIQSDQKINNFITLKIKIDGEDWVKDLTNFNSNEYINYDLVISKKELDNIKLLSEKINSVIIKKYEKENNIELKELLNKINSSILTKKENNIKSVGEEHCNRIAYEDTREGMVYRTTQEGIIYGTTRETMGELDRAIQERLLSYETHTETEVAPTTAN